MTIVLLASVSLFALVVSGRPVLSPDAELSDLAPPLPVLQTSIQTPLRMSSGKHGLTSDAAHFHYQSSQQHIEYLPELSEETIAPVASFQVSSEDRPTFTDEALNEQDVLEANDKYDETDKIAISGPVAAAPSIDSSAMLLVVLVFACIAALSVLACVSLTLCIVKLLRSQMLALKAAWKLLPRFWSYLKCQDNTTVTERHLFGVGRLLLQSERLVDAEGSAQQPELSLGEKPVYFDAASDMESEWDDVDEKYQDALDMTPLPLIHDLPLEDDVSRSSHYDDPALPHSVPYPLDPPMADRSSPLMREACASPLPVSRPAWSVRAIDSPALGLSSCRGGDDVSQPLVHPRRRAYHSPVPEFDIALAMQLRPGLGIGADPAWMVRFLMAIFGWFAVALTGNAR